MARPTNKDLLEYVPVNCPACSTEGFIRVDRLNRGLVCKRCQARFYIDHTGARVLGEPPAGAVVTHRKMGDPNPSAAERAIARWWQWSAAQLNRLPRPVRIAVLAVPLLLIVAGTGVWVSREPDATLPESLQERARMIGQGFGRGDTTPISQLAERGTGRAGRKWLDGYRPPTWGDEQPPETPIQVEVNVLFQNTMKKDARVVLLVFKPAGAIDAMAPPHIELITYWTLDDDGLWYLDGKRTLEPKE
jgi:hypothetical protein